MNPLDDLGDLAEEFGYEAAPKPVVFVAPFSGIGDGLPDIVDPRERCLRAIESLAALDTERTRLNKLAEAVYAGELETLWRQVKWRGKRVFDRRAAERELGEVASALGQKHVAAHKAVTVVEYESKRFELDKVAVGAAALVDIRNTTEDHWYFGDVYPDAYRSTGSGAKYAEARAWIIADDVRACGVDRVEVRKHEASTKTPFFAVYVWCIEADLRILRKKPGLPLQEQVRLAWKYGANPRVFWPHLPYEYEEQHGIDFFGNHKLAIEPAQMSESVQPEPEPV